MNTYSSLILKSEDVLLLLTKLQNIGWTAIREASINRILYLSAVLYSFRYPDKQNIFKDDYNFSRTLSGPEDAEIEKALIHLVNNDLVIHTYEGYVCTEIEHTTISIENYKVKEPWFDDISYILGIYGEDKIFDFIFRDPEYKNSLESNSLFSLNIGNDNDTVKYINAFKKAFENKIRDSKDKLQNKEYLRLYFEYVFGKILRGEK